MSTTKYMIGSFRSQGKETDAWFWVARDIFHSPIEKSIIERAIEQVNDTTL
jgi:hypothetical protein